MKIAIVLLWVPNCAALKITASQRSLTVTTASETTEKLHGMVIMTVSTKMGQLLTTIINLCRRQVKQAKSMMGTLYR